MWRPGAGESRVARGGLPDARVRGRRRRRRRRDAEAGVQAARGRRDDLVRELHPADLRPVVRPRRMSRRAGADGEPRSDGRRLVQAARRRQLTRGPALEARQAGGPGRELSRPEGRGGTWSDADAARLPGDAVWWRGPERRALSLPRPDRGDPAVGPRVRAEQLTRAVATLVMTAALL